jgi:hypothetical protein
VNYSQLSKNLGSVLRLRPHPVALDRGFGSISPVEDGWRLDNIAHSPRAITLTNTRNQATIVLQGDALQNYQHPRTLWLNVQVTVSDSGIELEPIARHLGRHGQNVPFQIDLPLPGSTNLEWVPIHGSGGPAGRRIFVFTWLIGTRCWLQPGYVEPAQDGRWVHPACNLHSPQERFIFAAAVHRDDSDAFSKSFTSETRHVGILETILRKCGVRFVLSDPRRLCRIR